MIVLVDQLKGVIYKTSKRLLVFILQANVCIVNKIFKC